MRIRKSKVLGLALNLMNECDVCTYCWNRNLNRKFGRSGGLGLDTNIGELMQQLERQHVPTPYPPEQCQFYINEGHDILLGAKTEFFHPKALTTAQNVLRLLECYPDIGNRVRILTKQDIREPSAGLLPDKAMIGCTVTTINDDLSASVESGAALPKHRVKQLQEFSEIGFKTWAVVEPFFKHLRLSTVISELWFVEELWVGRLNSGRGNIIKQGPFAGFTCGEVAATDAEITEQVVSNLRWLKEPTQLKIIGPSSGKPIKTRWVSDERWKDFKLYPKREVIRMLERADEVDDVLQLVPDNVLESARAKKQA